MHFTANAQCMTACNLLIVNNYLHSFLILSEVTVSSNIPTPSNGSSSIAGNSGKNACMDVHKTIAITKIVWYLFMYL